MDLLISVAMGALAALVVGLAVLLRSGPNHADARIWGATIGFPIRPSQAHPGRQNGPPRSVAFPVTSLAGLPVRRPALEGHGPKQINRREGPGGAPVVLAGCAKCGESRVQGRNYCRECGLRLSPFLQ